ncbi:hypothetical protein MMC18_005519 [Xylographa bjoerkii]|nr:hypothetical protein [Xylographa bjoerkii]
MPSKNLFLDLPLELRNMIYKLIYSPFTDDYGDLQVVCIRGECYTDEPRFLRQYEARSQRSSKLIRPQYATEFAGTFETGLLYVCHQTYVEAAPFLYGQQIFGLPSPDLTHEWLDSIGEQNLSHIRHVVISNNNELLVGLEDTMSGAWAEIIELLPFIKTMIVFPEELLRKPNWNMDRTGEAFLLRKAEHAISSLNGLAFLRLASHHCSLRFLKNKLNLETLILKPKFFGTEDWDDAFAHLPSLKNLFLDLSEVRKENMALFPADFLGNIAALRSFGWKGHPLPGSIAMQLQVRHGPTLRELHLEHGVAAASRPDPAVFFPNRRAPPKYLSLHEYQILVGLLCHLPHLTALRLKYQCRSSILCDLPSSLEQLDIAFVELNDKKLQHNARELPLQCPSLERLRLLAGYPETAHHEIPTRGYWTSYTPNGIPCLQISIAPKCHCTFSLHHLREQIAEVVFPLCLGPECDDDRLCWDRVSMAYEDDWARFPMVSPNGGRMWKEIRCPPPRRPARVPEGKGEPVVPILETGKPDEPSVWADYISNPGLSIHGCHGICNCRRHVSTDAIVRKVCVNGRACWCICADD